MTGQSFFYFFLPRFFIRNDGTTHPPFSFGAHPHQPFARLACFALSELLETKQAMPTSFQGSGMHLRQMQLN